MSRLKTTLLAGCVATGMHCAGKGPGLPPSTVPNPPVLTCPGEIAIMAHEGESEHSVSFDPPTVQDGQAPVMVLCSPESGSRFVVGTTHVTCMATDALMRQASCTFSVVVTPVPRIQATKFLAFGDSLTEGKPSRTPKIGPSIVVVPPDRFNQTGSYVDRLDSMLASRYQDQEITLIADGFGGEKVSAGTLRLQTDWPQHNPEVLLLMEGTNDLTSPDPPGGVEALNAVINGLRQMIRFAKGRGARVFLGTLPPLTAPQAAEVIASARVLNAKITTLAAAEQVPLVDHFAKIAPELVDGDGIHLIPHGYELMAEDWMSAIQATLEITTH